MKINKNSILTIFGCIFRQPLVLNYCTSVWNFQKETASSRGGKIPQGLLEKQNIPHNTEDLYFDFDLIGLYGSLSLLTFK